MNVASVKTLNNISVSTTVNKPINKTNTEPTQNKPSNINTKDTLSVQTQKTCMAPKISLFDTSKPKVKDKLITGAIVGAAMGAWAGGSVTSTLLIIEHATKSSFKAGAIVGAVIATGFVGMGVIDAVKAVKESKANIEETKKYAVESCERIKNSPPQNNSYFDDDY